MDLWRTPGTCYWQRSDAGYALTDGTGRTIGTATDPRPFKRWRKVLAVVLAVAGLPGGLRGRRSWLVHDNGGRLLLRLEGVTSGTLSRSIGEVVVYGPTGEVVGQVRSAGSTSTHVDFHRSLYQFVGSDGEVLASSRPLDDGGQTFVGVEVAGQSRPLLLGTVTRGKTSWLHVGDPDRFDILAESSLQEPTATLVLAAPLAIGLLGP